MSSSKLLNSSMIIAGTSIGAGMFSLPIVASGMWYFYGIIMLVFAWYCMYSSGLMLLETHLHFPNNTGFDTHTQKTLGKAGRVINGASVGFVLYILTYAYISGGGSILHYTLIDLFNLSVSLKTCSAIFGIALAIIVIVGTHWVGRISTVMLAIMAICFLIAMVALLLHAKVGNLIPQSDSQYWPYTFAVLPFLLTSFGYHGNVPGLVKYYDGNAKMVQKSIFFGSLTALLCYIIWLTASMSVLDRDGWLPIIRSGGNLGDIVMGLESKLHSSSLESLLTWFSNFAVASSFLGVTLGLLDYISDTLNLEDNWKGRCTGGIITFAPPIILGIIFPNGFIAAIGFAAVAAAIFAVITPALMVIVTRRKYSSSWIVSGGNFRVGLVLLFGVCVIAFHILSMLNVLPTYS